MSLALREKLIQLLQLLISQHCPRDDTLLKNLLTQLQDCFEASGNNMDLLKSNVFDAQLLIELEPDITSFLLELAGTCGQYCVKNSEELAGLENFFIELIRQDLLKSSAALCGWLHGIHHIYSKHTERIIPEEILSQIVDCVSDKRFFIHNESVLLLQTLMNNASSYERCKVIAISVRSAVESIFRNLKIQSFDLGSMTTILELLTSVYTHEGITHIDISDSSKPSLCNFFDNNEVVQSLSEILFMIPKPGVHQIGHILTLLETTYSSSKQTLSGNFSSFIEGILDGLLSSNEMVKVSHIAGWMLTRPSFKHMQKRLELIFISPINCFTENMQQSSYSAEVIHLNFRQISKLESYFSSPDDVFDACLRFVCKYSNTDVFSSNFLPSKCFYASLDALNVLIPKITVDISCRHGFDIVALLIVFKDDQIAVTRLLNVAQVILLKENDIEELASKLFPCLSVLIQSSIWDIRDSVLLFIQQICASRRLYVEMVKYSLHKLVWNSMDDEEPFVRAASMKCLLVLLDKEVEFKIPLDIKLETILEKVIDTAECDEEAIARRSAVVFLGKQFSENVSILFPSASSDFPMKHIEHQVLNTILKRVFEVLAKRVSDDSDWEVIISILKTFGEIILCTLFDYIWDYFINRINSETSIQKSDTHSCTADSFEFEKHVFSIILIKIFEACQSFDDAVKETARSIVASLKCKILKFSEKFNFSYKIEQFLKCFIDISEYTVLEKNSCINIATEADNDEWNKTEVSVENMNILEALIESTLLCMVPHQTHVEEGWRSDDDDFTDFSIVDCYN